jgi:hypothetical protein
MKIVFKVADGNFNHPIKSDQPPLTSPDLEVDLEVENEIHQTASEAEAAEKKKEKRRRRKKKRQRMNPDKFLDSNNVLISSDSQLLLPTVAPPHGSELSSGDFSVMNDNPPRVREPSLVEKVNTLMKHEASIGGISSAAAKPVKIMAPISQLLIIVTTTLITNYYVMVT